MAKSYVTYEGNGSTTTYPVTFPYLAKLHVYVLVGGEKTDEWEWLTNNSIKLDKAPKGPFSFIRRTPTEPLVDFADGTILTENQLDVATVQALYVAEEASDLARYALNNNPESPGGDGINWNAEGKKIINLANGTNPTDAVNKGQLDAIIPDIQEEVKKAEDAAEEAEEWAKKAEETADTVEEAIKDAVDEATEWAGIAEDWAEEAEEWAKEAEKWADKAEGHEKDAQAIVDSFNPAVTLMGDADVTKTAPIAKEGDAYINTVTGVAHSSWGSNFSGRTIKKDMLMVFGRDNDWHDTDLYSGIWTEEDGKAVYDGDIEVNGVTVGKGGGSGTINTAVGTDAKGGTGTQVTAIGHSALKVNNGNFNTAVGYDSMGLATEATYSTAVGISALQNLTTGANNTALGLFAGNTLTTGSSNTLIGYNAQPSAPDVSNEVTIGDDTVIRTRLKGEVETKGKLRVMSDNQPLETNVYARIGTGRAISLGQSLDDAAGLVKCSFQNELTSKGTNRPLYVECAEFQVYAGAANATANVKALTCKLDGEGPRTDIVGRLYVNGTNVSDSIPTGAIMMWSGATSAIPSGWKVCDGTNGTPDLRNRFVIGAGSTYALKATGGSKDAVNISHTHPVTVNTKTGLNGTLTLINRDGSSNANSLMRASTGSITTATTGQGNFGEGWNGAAGSNSSKATFTLDHNHTGSATASGVAGTDKNLPPYTALYYIMKTSSSRAVEEGQENVETIYSNEEVDKKLSIKDKLIEKLSKRLDKLEKRVK